MFPKIIPAFLTGLFLLLVGRVLSQTPNPGDYAKAVDFLPPPPSATAMIKHDAITVNKNTGIASINVPIYQLKGRKLNTDVALSYASSGIKVDEIASQVGMGWSLQAAGVVTRMVRGLPDEKHTRINPPAAGIGTDSASYHFLYLIGQPAPDYGGYDSEPDLFNFSFGPYSGSFVLDSARRIVMIHASPLKIVFDSLGTAWNFKITDPSGIVYYFGGTGATEKTKKDQTCGKLFDFYVPVAWHLIRIQHPNGEIISFNYTSLEYMYDTGLTQTQFYSTGGNPPGAGPGAPCEIPCQTPTWTDCEMRLHTQGVLLDNILLPGNSKLVFSYTSRLDYQYGKLLSRVTYYDETGAMERLVGFWDLTYNNVTGTTSYPHKSEAYTENTPYLVSAIQKSSDSSIALPYYFVYNDPGGRPYRLSYCQDHWGYFNGTSNNTLVPPPSDPNNAALFPLSTANREANPFYAAKGLLSKVIYPTGGMDSLIYEGNQVSAPSGNPIAKKYSLTGSITGTGLKTAVADTFYFTTYGGQTISVNMICHDNSGTGDYDPLHNNCLVDFYDATGASLYHRSIGPASTFNDNILIPASGTYKLQVTANGSVSTGSAAFSYFSTPINSTAPVSSPVGGVRVREVLTASANEKAMIKRYYYGQLNTLEQSSLPGVDIPLYFQSGSTRTYCTATNSYYSCYYYANYSNSLGGLYDFQGSPISYNYVVESLGGESFEQGGTQTTFLVGPDAPGLTLHGNIMYGAAKSNFSSFLNGKPSAELVFKRQGGTNVPLTQKLYSYKIDARLEPTVTGTAVYNKFFNNVTPDWNCTVDGTVPGAACGLAISNYNDAFDVTRYYVYSSWVYNDSLTEFNYDGGSAVMVNATKFYYDNTANLQLYRTETRDSKNHLIKTFYTYPHDYVGTAVYDSMINRNIVEPVIDVQKFKESTKLTETKTNFFNWGNGNFQPSTFQTSYSVGSLRDIGTITKYDGAGNILEFKSIDGIVNSVIWGFGNLYPVAKIYGAGYDQARAALSVDTSVINTLSGSSLLTQLNALRSGLPAAQITTYNYQPQTGALSITDLNNRPAYFDYDSFRRLMDAKDQDGNIVKQVTYHFANTSPNNTFYIYANDARTRTATTNCSYGYTGTLKVYGVPAGKYFSTVSVAAANALADAELDRYTQDNANRTGSCSFGGH